MLSILSLYNKLVCKGNSKEYVLYEMDETDSTNLRVREVAQANRAAIEQAKALAVVLTTDFQTAGRGQGTNTWESERGKNLLFSILVHPSMVPVQSQFLLSMMGALALKEALDTYVAEGITLKWPNDIYWNDKKISGTLIETSLSARHIKDCVFGVGLNVNQASFSDALPNPVSLNQIVGHEVDRGELLEKILSSFVKYYKMIEEGSYGDILALYHEALYRKHGFHAYRDREGEFEGAIVEVEDNGHLVMRDREGRIRVYALKDVQFVI